MPMKASPRAEAHRHNVRRKHLCDQIRSVLHVIALHATEAESMDPSSDTLYTVLDEIDDNIRIEMRINQLLSEDDVFGEV
jgi:hypothetical protein